MAKMLTTKDVQKLLHVDRSTVYRMVESGRLPALKIGKQWRFSADQIETWLQQQSTLSVPSTTSEAETSESVVDMPLKTQDFGSLLPLPCVQLIQDSFAEALGAMIVITDLAGQPVTEVSHPCGLFKAASQTPEALQKCINGWGDMANMLDLEPKFTPGHLGLLGTRAFVRCGSELKGMVFIGGIAPDDWPPNAAEVANLAAELEISVEALRPYLTDVFYLTGDQRALTLSLVQRIANILTHIVAERVMLTGKLESIAELVKFS